MAVFPISGPATRQPQQFAAPLNRTNPLSRGVVGWLGPRQFSAVPTVAGVPPIAARQDGLAYAWVGGGTSDGVEVTTQSINTGEYTVACVFHARALPSTSSGFTKIAGWCQGAAGGFFFNWDHNSAGVCGAIELFNGGLNGSLNLPDPSLGERTVWIGTISGTTLRGYVNGADAGSSAISTSAANWTRLFLGRNRTDNGSGAADTLLTVAWDRAITAAEALAFSRNPWQLFEDEPAFFFTGAAGGGGFQAAWARNANTMIQRAL